LKAQLAAIPAKVARQEEAEAEEKGEAFFHYLENGYLPWNSRINSLNEPESGIKLDDQLITRLKKTILKHPASAGTPVDSFLTQIQGFGPVSVCPE
jgi:hypothetical protein